MSLLLCVLKPGILSTFPHIKSPFIHLCSHSFLLSTISRHRSNNAVFWSGYTTCVVKVYAFIGERGEGHIDHICSKQTNNVTDISWERSDGGHMAMECKGPRESGIGTEIQYLNYLSRKAGSWEF